MRFLWFVSMLFLPFIGPISAASADGASLYEILSRRSQVKIYVALPADDTGKGGLDPALLKETLEKQLKERKSIRFQVVPSEPEAELALDTRIAGFVFSETDPVDMLVGAAAIALDAAQQEHFASAEASFTLRDVKDGKTLWKDKLKGSETHPTMTEAESGPKVAEKIAKVFVREAFGKKKR